jgi:hypothetical protein
MSPTRLLDLRLRITCLESCLQRDDGPGDATTLYAAVNLIRTGREKILTVGIRS